MKLEEKKTIMICSTPVTVESVHHTMLDPENLSAFKTHNSSHVIYPEHGDTGSDVTRISFAETIIIGAILVSVFIASLVANASVFVVFSKRKTLSISNRFVANLTICNCLNTVFVTPVAVTSLLANQWLFGTFWCVCTGFMMNVLVSASIFTLAVISIDRYCAVVTPLHYSMLLTSRRCYGFIICIWVAAIFISAPPLFGWNAIEFQLDKMVCTVKWSSSTKYDSHYTFFLISFSFLLPLIAMLWTYFRIFSAAHGNIVRTRRSSVIRINAAASQSDENVQATPINSRRRSSSVPIIRRFSQSSSRSSSLLWRKEEWKAAVTSFLVLFSFAVCWTPYFVVMAIEAGRRETAPLYSVASHISTVLATFSCACNPIVYVFRSKLVREELRRILRGRGSIEHICIPREINRRASVARNDSGRSLSGMGGVAEEKEGDVDAVLQERQVLTADST